MGMVFRRVAFDCTHKSVRLRIRLSVESLNFKCSILQLRFFLLPGNLGKNDDVRISDKLYAQA